MGNNNCIQQSQRKTNILSFAYPEGRDKKFVSQNYNNWSYWQKLKLYHQKNKWLTEIITIIRSYSQYHTRLWFDLIIRLYRTSAVSICIYNSTILLSPKTRDAKNKNNKWTTTTTPRQSFCPTTTPQQQQNLFVQHYSTKFNYLLFFWSNT